MMQKWFNQDTPFMRKFQVFANLVELNLLFLLCCLPIVTIGASTTALYRCMFALGQDEESGNKAFFNALRRNFKTATICWLVLLIASLVIYADYRFTANQSWPFVSVLLVIYGMFALVLVLTGPFLFALISQFDATIWQTLKNAFLCGMIWLPRTLLLFAIWAFPFVWLLFFPYSFWRLAWVWITFGFALAAFLSVKLMKKPFAVLKAKYSQTV